MDTQKTRIRYRLASASDDTPWEECLGCCELCRRLSKVTGKHYDFSSVAKASNGKNYGKHKYKDYVFYKV
eukprot:2088188-Prymnesium_polylepis.1